MNIKGIRIRFRLNLSDWLIGIDWFDREMRSWGTHRMVCLRFLCLGLIIEWGEV